MIDICYKIGSKYGITLNPAKRIGYKPIHVFDINGVAIQNVG